MGSIENNKWIQAILLLSQSSEVRNYLEAKFMLGAEGILVLIKQVNDLGSSIVMVEKYEETPMH